MNQEQSADDAGLPAQNADWLRSIGGTYLEQRDLWFWTLSTSNQVQWQRGMVWIGHPRSTPLAIATGVDERRQLLAILAALRVSTEAK